MNKLKTVSNNTINTTEQNTNKKYIQNDFKNFKADDMLPSNNKLNPI